MIGQLNVLIPLKMIPSKAIHVEYNKGSFRIYGLGGGIFQGDEKFWTHREGGGRRFLDASRRGGKNFRLDLEFFKVCENNFKTIYICF